MIWDYYGLAGCFAALLFYCPGADALSMGKNWNYIAFYKPYHVVSQFQNPSTAADEKMTLASFAFPEEVYPVGRLDYDSEGLLLLSNDGKFTSTLMEPRHGHTREYWAQVEGVPGQSTLQQLRAGVVIAGKLTLPAGAEIIKPEPSVPPRPVPIRFRKSIPTTWLKLILTEGRNRQVRRMTAAVGHPTLRLIRVAIGSLRLESLDLSCGEWCYLSPGQVQLALKKGSSLVIRGEN